MPAWIKLFTWLIGSKVLHSQALLLLAIEFTMLLALQLVLILHLDMLAVAWWNQGLGQCLKYCKDVTLPGHLKVPHNIGHGGILSAYGYISNQKKQDQQPEEEGQEKSRRTAARMTATRRVIQQWRYGLVVANKTAVAAVAGILSTGSSMYYQLYVCLVLHLC